MNRNIIWILDSNPADRAFYQAVLSGLYTIEFFDSHVKLESEYYAKSRPRPALLISDMKLPDGRLDEISVPVIHTFRDIPTIVITQIDEERAIHKAMESGAIDYLLKPVSPHILNVKIARFMMSPLNGARRPLQKAIFDQMRNVTQKERLILEFFLSMDDHIATRAQVIGYVWKGLVVSKKTLDVHFYHIRRKIRDWGYDIRSLTNERFQLVTSDQQSGDSESPIPEPEEEPDARPLSLS